MTTEIEIKNEQIQLTKAYYTIGEVGKIFGEANSLIRFWETEFSIIKPKKNNKGERKFTPQDIVNINQVYTLVKIKGYTLEGAKMELKNISSNHIKINILKKKLVSLRNKLDQLKKDNY